MMDYTIEPLTNDKVSEAVDIVVEENVDTRDDAQFNLSQVANHFVAVYEEKVIGIISWYHDDVHYADKAMGDKFPGEDAFWVELFAIKHEFQHQGIGDAMLRYIENILRDMYVKELWVSSTELGFPFYTHRGFSIVIEGEIDGDYKRFMVKKI